MSNENKMTWREASQKIGDAMDAANKDLDEMADKCPYETKLAVTRWAIKHIVDHARDGGSYRYLIYDRLGFGPDAYVPLYYAGGMTITNEFELKDKN